MANTKVKAEAASAAPATEEDKSIQNPRTELTDATVKKTRVKKVMRTIEELHSTAAKKMNPDEAAKYIDFMRDECTQLQEQLRSMTLNAQSSYEQASRATSTLESYKRKAAGELAFVKQTISTCYAAILRCEIPEPASTAACNAKYGVKEG